MFSIEVKSQNNDYDEHCDDDDDESPQLNIKCHDRKCFQSLRNEQALYHHSMVFKMMVDSEKAIQDNVNEWKSLVAHCNLVKVSPTMPMMDLPPF